MFVKKNFPWNTGRLQEFTPFTISGPETREFEAGKFPISRPSLFFFAKFCAIPFNSNASDHNFSSIQNDEILSTLKHEYITNKGN
jgi:hypothetical protein